MLKRVSFISYLLVDGVASKIRVQLNQPSQIFKTKTDSLLIFVSTVKGTSLRDSDVFKSSSVEILNTCVDVDLSTRR